MKCDAIVLIMCMLIWLSGGTCTGSNIITHTHTAVAESAGWSQSTLPDTTTSIVQTQSTLQSTLSAVFGEGNTVSQSNTAGSYGSGALQIQEQDNVALVEGNRNNIIQGNVALFIADTETYYSKLVQKNLVLVLGSDNTAVQSNTESSSVSTSPDIMPAQLNAASSTVTNTVTTESDVAVMSSTSAGNSLDSLNSGAIYSTEQAQVAQVNVGFIVGERNWLYQSNRATLFRHMMSNPSLWRRQINRAIAVNNGLPAVTETGV